LALALGCFLVDRTALDFIRPPGHHRCSLAQFGVPVVRQDANRSVNTGPRTDVTNTSPSTTLSIRSSSSPLTGCTKRIMRDQGRGKRGGNLCICRMTTSTCRPRHLAFDRERGRRGAFYLAPGI
jgi:hypothetical protein